MNHRLVIDDLSSINPRFHRLFECEPEVYYQRAESLSYFSYFKRKNCVSSGILFPQEDKKICACGCGGKLSGRRYRWATDACNSFASQVIRIINGDSELIRRIINEIYTYACCECGKCNEDFKVDLFPPNRKEYDDFQKFMKDYDKWVHNQSSKIHLDHIVPVHQGGGACWLSNYQFLCVDCHKIKSKNERK